MRAPSIVAAALLFGVSAAVYADSQAYVVAAGVDERTPGSITPLDTAKGALGAPFFVPAGGNFMAIAPSTKQLWEASTAPNSIYVLDPKSGRTLATIPLPAEAVSLVLDPAGRYAYAPLIDYDLIKIDVASRSIVRTISVSGLNGSNVAVSTDGSEIFVDASLNGVLLVLDTNTLGTLASIPISGGVISLFVSGTTLLVGSVPSLLYFDTNTLQQTNTVGIPNYSWVFGVSPDQSKIYVGTNCDCSNPESIEILDFSSGQILVSQNFPNVAFNPPPVLLSEDGTQIVVASSPVLLVDSATLATTNAITPIGTPSSAIYLDADTVLMLYPEAGAMMVVDQSSAQLTGTFPLGVGLLSGEVADPKARLIYVGGLTYGGNLTAASAKLNRVVGSFPVLGFGPSALVADRLYGAPRVYSLATGALTSLPPPVVLPQANYSWFLGSVPPNQATYWAPFTIFTHGFAVGSGVTVYSTATDKVVAAIPAPLPGNGPEAFSPDSSTAYIGEPGVIATYSTATFKQTATFSYTTTFTSLAVSPDGSVLYGTDGTAVYVLDAATGEQQQAFKLPAAVQGVMALSPDGTTLFITDSTASAVDLINTESGQVTIVPVPYTPTSVVVLP